LHVTTLGDVMLDVIVDVPGGLRPDDDAEAQITLAAGGQAANVAAWSVALGATATVIGPRGSSGAAQLIAARLAGSGINLIGIDGGEVGTVVSIVESGTRTMASDPGIQSWPTQVRPSDVPPHTSWLHLSSYPLLRTNDPGPVIELADHASASGSKLSLDLSSATLLNAYGPERFATLAKRLDLTVLFANRTEWETISPYWKSLIADVVVKDGSRGATVLQGGLASSFPSRATDVVDATGAGDALAAGYLVGGIELALDAAAQCVRTPGAQPRP
jgi:ribokinase